MTTGKLSVAFLLLLLFCLKYGESGVKKIKIHVPYYVKHVHHYKKVYVPKVHVIKHEHHHKKEYDHHHHHHEVYKHGPYRSYEKSSHEYPDEVQHQDVYYDDIGSKAFRSVGRKRPKPYLYRSSAKEQYRGWKDVDGSDYSGEEEDFAAYRKNIYFKRRLDAGKQEDEEEEEEEEDEEQGSEEEEDESTAASVNNENIISITTTESTLK